MIKKNKTQLNYLYGEDAVKILEDSIKKAIKDGNCVTLPIDSLDDFDYKHLVTAKVKLLFKRLFKKRGNKNERL